MKLNFNFSGKTLLKDWWKIVRDNFTAIQTDHNELSDSVNTHKTAEVIDHPDKSVTSTKIADKAIRTAHIANYAITKDKVANGAVTTDKIAANSITVNELTLDIVANLGKANTFLYSDGEPIYLSECKDTVGIGYELPDDIPVNVFFKLENDTDSALTKFQSHDDYYTTLSCDIAPGEVRICVLIQEEVGGADPQNGYLFVLDDNSIRKLLNDKAPTNHASGATTYGVGDATNYGHLKLSDSVNSSNSTGNGCAATPKATKTAYDKAVEAYELANQNQYTHPSTHPASMIVQDSTHRFVSDDETSDWDNKLDANFISNGYAGIDEVTTTLNDMWSDRVAPPTTITISSSTSKHMLTADYYCSGTNDQTVINNAISALPSTGGKIVLLEGTYNIGGTITINKSNVTIQGLGHNVILKTATSTTALKMFGISNATGLIISDIVIDYANNTSADCIAIQLYSSDNVIIEHINILNNKGNGIEWFNCNYTRFSDISFINVRQCIWDRGRNHSSIIDKWIVDTVTNGITLDSSSTLNKIVDCIVRSATDNGIKSDAAYTMINDNIVYGCSNGITVNGNCSTVADNNVRDSDIGISVNGKYVNVSGNTAIRADDSGNVSSYSSSQYTISMGSSSANCLVIGNIISGKNYTNNGASTNTFANNKY